MSAIALLFHRSGDQVVAWRNTGPVSLDAFLHEVEQVAGRLPQRSFVFNLCSDRYHFLVTFCAAMLRGQTSLLPPNHAAQTLAQLHAAHPDAYGIVDRPTSLGGLEMFSYPALPSGGSSHGEIPLIAAEHIAAIAFTSGSTGQSMPHLKSWGSLTTEAGLAASRLGIEPGCHFLGTVPPQHMYGLGSTLMLPLHNGGVIHAGQPLFPADIRLALADLPAPRVLVTTPLHLRICLEQQAELPPLALIFSAAAPLSFELAQQAEHVFGAPLMEIYGSTETGTIATRRTAHGEDWNPLAGVTLTCGENGRTWVEGGHIQTRIELQDVIETTTEQHFRLAGRAADMLNIAGKRASLGELNRQLNGIPGVRDGVFFAPDEAPGKAVRLCALVVAPELSEQQITAALRHTIDPAFLPRPLYKVDALPRNATGKLPREALREFIASLATRPAS
ncbi:MAG: beta-hydroxyacyl-ACP dehydratase [Nitrosomonadales bacterium]|nr:MAG: beta-hydroxyacyl-ACP dehydratase [Nitrosomonadales bacterium]